MKRLAFLLPLVLLASACSKKEDAPPAQVPHVAGTWSGNGTDDAIGFFNVSMDITQSGDSAAGTFTMAGSAATITGDVSIALGPQGGNNLQALSFARKSWTVADPANAGRVCAAAMIVQPNVNAMTGSAVSFRYSMTDCQGGTWAGGANLHKIAGTN